jgi:putative endonuclease
MAKGGYVYIITNDYNTTLYTGVTSDLKVKMYEHVNKIYPLSFSSRYQCTKLVYVEFLECIEDAIAREKQIKAGSRKKKIELIESLNPSWKNLHDLY